MLEITDPFRLRRFFDNANFLLSELGDLEQDLRFLRLLRRAALPLPTDRDERPAASLFPPLSVEPHPVLSGKRVGLIVSGGSGALVTLCGVMRALEEADVRVAALSVCSGGAIWGAMVAAGFTAQQMVDECLSWTPQDKLDTDWASLAKIPLTLGRGFRGLAKGDAFERTLDRALGGVTLAEAPIPYHAVVLDIDSNKLSYFGPKTHPEVKLSTMARVAIALPLFVRPVEIEGRSYVDGGVVNIFPVDGLLTEEEPFDYFIGVNAILPPGFDGGEDISGWAERPLGILEMSKQLWHTQHIEMARQQLDKIRDRTLLLEPIPYDEIAGSKFYEVFIDSSKWPRFIQEAYRDTRARLREFA